MKSHELASPRTTSTTTIKQENKEDPFQDNNKYNQSHLLSKLLRFSTLLEKKLELELGDECKSIPPLLERKDVAYLPNEELSSLKKLKIVKYMLQNKYYFDCGFCFGLTMLLLSKSLLKKNPDEYYNMVRTIINCPQNQLLTLEKSLSNFYFSAIWAQHPFEFFTKPSGVKTYCQQDSKEILSQLTQLPIDYYHAHLFKETTRSEFLKLLEELNENKVMRLTAVPSIPTLVKRFLSKNKITFHTLGIYCDAEKNFYLYDSNYLSGKAKKFSYNNRNKIYDEILAINHGDPNNLHLNYDIFQNASYSASKKTVRRTLLGFNIWGNNTPLRQKEKKPLKPIVNSPLSSALEHRINGVKLRK